MRHIKIGLSLLVALLVGFAGMAQATSFSLGNVSGPSVFNVENIKDTGPFLDKIHFIIDPGVTLVFSALVGNYATRHDGIYDLEGTLSDASGVILNGDAVVINPLPYPDREITFPATLLGPGHYYLSLFGHAYTDVARGSPYYATIQFAATPLPASLLMMLTALGGFGLLGWRRSGRAAAS